MEGQSKRAVHRRSRSAQSQRDPFRKMPVVDQQVSSAYRFLARRLNVVLRDGYCTPDRFDFVHRDSIEPFYLYAEKLKNGSTIAHYPHLSRRDVTSVIRLIGRYFKETKELLDDIHENGGAVAPRSSLSYEMITLSGLIDSSYEQLMTNMQKSRRRKRTGSDAINYELKVQQLKKFVAELTTVVDFHFLLINNLESGTGVALGVEESRIIAWMIGRIEKIRPSRSLAYIDQFAPAEERIAFTVAFPRFDESLCFDDRVRELCRYLYDCKFSTDRVIPNAEQEAVLRYIDWTAKEMPQQSKYGRSRQTTVDEFIDTKRTFLTACILLANSKTDDFIKTVSAMSDELMRAIPKTRPVDSGVGYGGRGA